MSRSVAGGASRGRRLILRLFIGWICLGVSLGILRLFPSIDSTAYDLILISYRNLPLRYDWAARGYTGLHRSIVLVGSEGLYRNQDERDHLEVIRHFRGALASAVSWITPDQVQLPRSLQNGPLTPSPVYVRAAGTERNPTSGEFPFIMRQSDQDGVVRRTYLALKTPRGPEPCLPLALYARFLDLGDSPIEVSGDTLRLGDIAIPVSEDELGYMQPLLPYQRDLLSHYKFNEEGESLTKVVDSMVPLKMGPLLDPKNPLFRTVGEDGAPIQPMAYGRFVFLGEDSLSSAGQKLTAMGSFRDFQIAAMALDTLIQGPWIRHISGWKAVLFYFLVSSGLALWMLSPTSLTGRVVRLLLVYLAFHVLARALFAAGLYLPLAWLHLYALLLTSWSVAWIWLRTIAYLRRYGGTSAAQALLRGGRDLDHSQVEERLASIVFVGLPEHLRALETADDPRMLEHRQIFSELVAQEVQREQGLVHDFQADYLMLGFGTQPGTEDPNHARRALEVSRRLVGLSGELRRRWGLAESEAAGSRIQVSMNSGPLAIGWVGTREHKRASAAIGDTTNVAARLLGTARKLDLDMILSGSAYALVKDLGRFEALEPVRLKGKSEPVEVYRVLPL